MRSGFMSRLFNEFSFSTKTLQGGYQAFRRFSLEILETLHFSDLRIIGGLTGRGKTSILHALRDSGEQIIDLEALANHRGSAFGAIGLPFQPSQEQFENQLAIALTHLDLTKTIWIEDEGRLIGRCHLPPILYQQMMQSPLYYIHQQKTNRLKNLMMQYGKAEKKLLLEGVNRITKRLGSQLTNEIKNLIELQQIEQALEKLLVYYDKTYQYQILKRKINFHIELPFDSCYEEWGIAVQRTAIPAGYPINGSITESGSLGS